MQVYEFICRYCHRTSEVARPMSESATAPADVDRRRECSLGSSYLMKSETPVVNRFTCCVSGALTMKCR